jgi:glycosyltransferase involved in cell wall biosynthesis
LKKALIITHLDHATPRITGLAKYLNEYEWEPIILSPEISPQSPNKNSQYNFRVEKTVGYVSHYGEKRLASKEISKIRPVLKALYKPYKEIKQYPDADKNWKPFALRDAEKFLQTEKIDALISSSSPVISHIVAQELRKKYKIPWIADLRDPWTQTFYYPYSFVRKWFEQRLELRTLATADVLVTISRILAVRFKAFHNKATLVIPNGFEPEILNGKRARLTEEFTITFTGQIYKKYREPTKFFIALKDLISSGEIDKNDVKVRFYGTDRDYLEQKTREFGLTDIVTVYGRVSREVALEKQKESQLLLQLNWESQKERGFLSGKIFEYLASQRPILATGGFGDDATEELLNETNAGAYCATVEEIKEALKKFYGMYKSEGKVDYLGKMDQIDKYSYREMARKFAEILDSIQTSSN